MFLKEVVLRYVARRYSSIMILHLMPLIDHLADCQIAISKYVADLDISGSRPKDEYKPQPSSIKHPTIAHQPPKVNKHRDTVSKLYHNDSPRQEKRVPQWLYEWEEKWNIISKDEKLTGRRLS